MLRNLIAILFLSVVPSSASLITVTSVDWTRGGNTTFQADGVEETGFAGLINATFEGTPMAFLCVDLFTNIGYGDYSSTPILPRALRNEDRAAWLYLYALPNVTTVVQGQALQLAIWDIIHDGGNGFSLGRVQQSAGSSAAVIQAASDYLVVSLGKSSFAASIYLNSVPSSGAPAQAFLGAFQPVPEGGSMGLMALGGLALVAVGSYRRG